MVNTLISSGTRKGPKRAIEIAFLGHFGHCPRRGGFGMLHAGKDRSFTRGTMAEKVPHFVAFCCIATPFGGNVPLRPEDAAGDGRPGDAIPTSALDICPQVLEDKVIGTN